MDVRDLVAAMEWIAPTRYAERWDNVGLLVGDPAAELTRVMLAVDLTRAVLDEAAARGCEAVVAYHPPIFEALKRVTAGSVVFDAIRRGVAVYTPHTALDVADGGTNDVLADALGMTDRAPLRLVAPPDAAGIGRVGVLPPTPRVELIERARGALGVARLLVAGPREGDVTSAAVCAGAGAELLPDAIARGVGFYLTGELRHHDALRAARAGVTVVCALHSNSERVALARLAGRLRDALPSLAVEISAADRDPFDVV